ncbi:DegV family protein [Deinococcus yavapaiensis]|uniref:DegV family protein with EDD domain n=1 Tax=Deinococcus yavapaiensis KR-236 TaxID=694435 RepID=A0A318S8C5_9DEIO|nr:DegV family protein [Deinococcus yavapaiensis]PYE54375.1 DegV family protein with EDD domain [Deinococcus yavapaiensis KR-236]
MTTSPSFDVVSDGGLDKFEDLLNDVPAAPFALHFGNTSYLADQLPREAFFRELKTNASHPTTSQPTPQQFAEMYTAARRPVLCVTISAGLSGSRSAAEQARSVVPNADVTIHDSRTLSAAQAFQVHAAMTARNLGHSVDTAKEWMTRVSDETELYFTIDTLEYLKKGGRIGRVQAALGGLLNLKPIVTVDKTSGTYVNAARARSWSKALETLAAQVTAKYGAGTPLRVGLLYGDSTSYAAELLEYVKVKHPIVWSGAASVGPALAVHTGPKAAGLAVAPGPWPWER